MKETLSFSESSELKWTCHFFLLYLAEPRGIVLGDCLVIAAIRGRHWTSKDRSTRQWGLRGVSGPISFLSTHTPTATLIPRKPYKIRVTRDREMDSVRLLKLPVLLFLAFSLFL